MRSIEIPELDHLWKAPLCGERTPYVMIVMHGRGDSIEGMEWLQEELKLQQFNFLFLNAPTPYYEGYSWYAQPPHQGPGIRQSSKILAKVLNRLHRGGVRWKNCFLIGFSQGSLMTLEFGSRFPHTLGGYIGISGYCYNTKGLWKEKSARALKGNWLITHGKRDDALPIRKTRAQMHELIEWGFPMEYREYNKSHTIDSTLEIPYIRRWVLKILANQK